MISSLFVSEPLEILSYLAILALGNAFVVLGRVLLSPLASASLVLVVELAGEGALAGLLAIVVYYLDVIALA